MGRLERFGNGATRVLGQSLVEFALILPIFVLLLVGIFDLGRAVYATSTLNNAAREAGRLAIVDQTIGHIQAEAIKQSVGLGLGTADVSIDFRDPSTPNTPNSCGSPITIGCIADVKVSYAYGPATPIIDRLVGPLHLNGETKFSVEAICAEPTQPICPPGS